MIYSNCILKMLLSLLVVALVSAKAAPGLAVRAVDVANPSSAQGMQLSHALSASAAAPYLRAQSRKLAIDIDDDGEDGAAGVIIIAGVAIAAVVGIAILLAVVLPLITPLLPVALPTPTI